MSGTWRSELASSGAGAALTPNPSSSQWCADSLREGFRKVSEPAVHNGVTTERCGPSAKLPEVSVISLLAVLSLPGSLAGTGC